MTRSPFLISSFIDSGSTSFPCPDCGALLEVTSDDIKAYETKSSEQLQKVYGASPEELDYRFTARLKCPSKQCATDVVCVGAASVDQVPVEDDHGEIMNWEWMCFYSPHFFYPNLRMAKIPVNCPDTVKNRMEASFSQFFFSVNGALNELRGALEALLDALDVPRLKADGKRMVLHDRIESLPAQHSSLQKLFLAMKVLGNSGTHVDDGFEKKDLLDGYQLMEAVLEAIFPSDDPSRIHQLADKVLAKAQDRRQAARNS